VVDKVRAWRASVAAEAFALSGQEAGPIQALSPGHGGSSGAALARVLPMPAREE
jgi:hypothetical protein